MKKKQIQFTVFEAQICKSKAARTHSTQECNQLAKLNQRLEAGTESEKEEDRPSKDGQKASTTRGTAEPNYQ